MTDRLRRAGRVRPFRATAWDQWARSAHARGPVKIPRPIRAAENKPDVHYLGGKAKWGRKIAEIISVWRNPGVLWIDGTCGALNVVRHAAPPRIALDLCQPLVTLLQASQAGWNPPESLSEEQYAWIKRHPDPNHPMTAFVMFGCSFGGKWGAGYARDPRQKEGFCPVAKRSLARKMADCRDLDILHADVLTMPNPPPDSIVYLDPPYEGTTPYAGVPPFDHARLWTKGVDLTRDGALVFVSEGSGSRPPADWYLLHEFHVKGTLAGGTSGLRAERLYVHRSSPMGWAVERGYRPL